MQLIERLFGLYPDGGSGILELSLMAILLSAVIFRVALRLAIKPRETSTGPRHT